jgi:hypothetical protein
MVRAPTPSVWCFTCAGNGRIYEPAGNGEGLVVRACPTCLGVSLV